MNRTFRAAALAAICAGGPGPGYAWGQALPSDPFPPAADRVFQTLDWALRPAGVDPVLSVPTKRTPQPPAKAAPAAQPVMEPVPAPAKPEIHYHYHAAAIASAPVPASPAPTPQSQPVLQAVVQAVPVVQAVTTVAQQAEGVAVPAGPIRRVIGNLGDRLSHVGDDHVRIPRVRAARPTTRVRVVSETTTTAAAPVPVPAQALVAAPSAQAIYAAPPPPVVPSAQQ